MKTQSITLELDPQQVRILLSAIETRALKTPRTRSQAGLRSMVADVKERGYSERDCTFSFEVLKLAPVYRELLKCCARGEPAEALNARSSKEFAAALVSAETSATKGAA